MGFLCTPSGVEWKYTQGDGLRTVLCVCCVLSFTRVSLRADNDFYGYRLQPCMDGVKEPNSNTGSGMVLVLLHRGLRGHSVLAGSITQFNSQCVPFGR